jgi:hypothetical protein
VLILMNITTHMILFKRAASVTEERTLSDGYEGSELQ